MEIRFNKPYIEDLREYIFPIFAEDKKTGELISFLGTGFFINSEGYFLTANHVVNVENDVYKLFILHKEKKCYINIIETSKKPDLALGQAHLDNENFYLKFYNEDVQGKIAMGTEIINWGYSGTKIEKGSKPNKIKLYGRFSKGYICHLSLGEIIWAIEDLPIYECSFPLIAGNSGSPLIMSSFERNNVICFSSVFTHNTKSGIEEESYEEICENGNVEKIKIMKIIEFAVAYDRTIIIDFMEGTNTNLVYVEI